MLARTEVSRIPIPPVVRGMGLLVVVVMLGRFAEQRSPGGDVCGRVLPLPAGQAGLDLLEQPPVSVRIAERGQRLVGPALRVWAGNRPPVQVEQPADLGPPV